MDGYFSHTLNLTPVYLTFTQNIENSESEKNITIEIKLFENEYDIFMKTIIDGLVTYKSFETFSESEIIDYLQDLTGLSEDEIRNIWELNFGVQSCSFVVWVVTCNSDEDTNIKFDKSFEKSFKTITLNDHL